MWGDILNCITSDADTHEERVSSMCSNLNIGSEQAEELVCAIESCME